MEVDLTDNASLRDLKHPVALFFSYIDADQYDFYCQNNEKLANINNKCRDQLVDYLKNAEYPVVSDENSLAAHPGSIVVTRHGIQTPFIEPDKAQNFAMQLIVDINNSGFARPMSFVLGCTIEQLSPSILFPQQYKGEYPFIKHPDGRMLQFLQYRYGKNFLEEMRNEAYRKAESIKHFLKQPYDVKNLDEDLYSGRSLMLEATTIHARGNLESRYLNYGTPSYEHATIYANFGAFIHHFAKSADQEYYKDFGIELGAAPETDPSKQIETLILPHKNKYKGVEIFFKDRRFIIPLEDDRWQAFAEFYRPAYLPDNSIMNQRRTNMIAEAKSNNNYPKCYMPAGYTAQDLILERLEINRPLVLEDQLFSKPTNVRKNYTFWEKSVSEQKIFIDQSPNASEQKILKELRQDMDNLLQKVRNFRAEENAQKQEKNSNKENSQPDKPKSNSR